MAGYNHPFYQDFPKPQCCDTEVDTWVPVMVTNHLCPGKVVFSVFHSLQPESLMADR